MLRVITDWMSCRSSFNLVRLRAVRVSRYSFLVRWMKVSNLMKAYGRAVGPGRNCAPRHRVSFDTRDEGSVCVG